MAKKGCLFLALLFLLPALLFAGQSVPINENASAYLALPRDSGSKAPAVLLIHEWWGLNSQIKGLADRFAEEGYVALAVDLYRGQVAESREVAHELMRGLPDDRALGDLKDALTYLQKHPRVYGDRLGVIGWCMGGGWALRLALEDPRVAAVNMYYGRLVTDEKKLENLKAPLLGIFGAEDRGISADSVREFERQLQKLKKRAEIHIYPGAGHAFANPEGGQYRPGPARDAWEKTLLFFKTNLS